MNHKLSVIITTYNEEDNISGVLESVRWSDEIIVVDSFSVDNTVAIAKNYTGKILQREYKGPADQKNWAIPQAGHRWVLILDADERVTLELQKEIQNLLMTEKIPCDAYWIGRENHFMKKKIRYSGWQNDAVIRLINRDKCRYNHLQVHEEIETQGIKVGYLKNKLVHYTYKNIDHFLAKMQRYALWSAKDHQHQTPTITIFHLLIKPFFRFFKHFILKKGFLDGKIGLVVSVIMAWGVFLRYLYILEKRTMSNEQ